jgi:subtilisin-like proprotein convertase family protein
MIVGFGFGYFSSQLRLNAMARLQLDSAEFTFQVTNTLICEHVAVRLTANHPSRGNLRITLTSPSGSRSILQRLNTDTSSGPQAWTYWSVHHFAESSAGIWKVAITDEFATGSGSVEMVGLIIEGTSIADSDVDGLDDNWELANFGLLTQSPKNDPDSDGFNNAREQLMGTDPNSRPSFQLDLSKWNSLLYRLSWPASTNFNYEVWSGTNVAALQKTSTVPGQFPETEWFASTSDTHQFFRIVAQPAP